jgi:surface antigen
MGMVASAFTDSGPPAGVDMAATASDADGDPLILAGQTWARGESLPSDGGEGGCPLDGEPAGMLDPTSEVDVAAYLLSAMGATPSAGPDQLGTALTSFYLVAVTGLPTPSDSGAAAAATAWVQSVLLVRYSAYAAWLSGGALQVASAACSGPIGTVCPEPATAVFPWVPSGGYPDSFPLGQCTWWAAYNSWAISEYGVGGDADGPGSDSWISSAESRMPAGSVQLAAQGGVPALGEVVVYWPGGSYDATDGHVAVVVAVDPDPSASSGISGYWVSEANFIGLGQVDERHIAWPDPQVRGFILASPQEVSA